MTEIHIGDTVYVYAYDFCDEVLSGEVLSTRSYPGGDFVEIDIRHNQNMKIVGEVLLTESKRCFRSLDEAEEYKKRHSVPWEVDVTGF